jgi:hypothetical protein
MTALVRQSNARHHGMTRDLVERVGFAWPMTAH